MSFVEKNKAWLLPLLGVAVLGVVYMNLRTAFSPPAPPAPPAGSEAPAPETQAQVAPAPAAERPPDATGADLWEDLRGFAVAPPFLADENSFRDQARRSALAAIHEHPQQAVLTVPAGVREPLPPPPKEKAGLGGPVSSGTVPELDFLIHGARGPRAWLEGKPYRTGQMVEGDGFQVGPIGYTSVELHGPAGKGKTILSTNPLHPS